ncbi:hypothetical protein AGOR_G00122560 [Albula goreensis]|uniref:BPTI/Kunitz inhibitor domain-containing protein n=1 Tax=Albula goreensis TaxID=1534307 RepID=A0A8T3DFU8_9TELE|nr:hypothetical protein AGOR_G00122560 [Albula goreensis]
MQDGKDVCQMRKMTAFTAYKKRQLQASPRVENRSAAESADRCAAPMVVGSCRAAFPRFYYDAANQSCRQFIYGGCGGNANNFETLEACKAACNRSRVAEISNEVPSGPVARRMTSTDLDAAPPKASLPEMTSDEYAEVCQAEPMTGPCRASILRFFYNSSTGACQSFIYGGCRGNRNNHASADECLATCTVTIVPSGKKAPSDEKSCAGKGDPGPCRAAFSKFYFDSDTTSCQPFTYGGCQGNGNRYDSVADCMLHCAGMEGNLDEHGQNPNRWTPAFFMVTTLVLMAAVLLVGLVLISVRKMKGRQRRSRDDKQELLPEDQLATEQNA